MSRVFDQWPEEILGQLMADHEAVLTKLERFSFVKHNPIANTKKRQGAGAWMGDSWREFKSNNPEKLEASDLMSLLANRFEIAVQKSEKNKASIVIR